MRAVNNYAGSGFIEVTCDEIHQHDRHRAMLEKHRLRGTPGFNSTHLAQIAGELRFVSSTESAMIQAADLVAYLKHRIASRPHPAPRVLRTRSRMWRVIADQIEHDYCWVP